MSDSILQRTSGWLEFLTIVLTLASAAGIISAIERMPRISATIAIVVLSMASLLACRQLRKGRHPRRIVSPEGRLIASSPPWTTFLSLFSICIPVVSIAGIAVVWAPGAPVQDKRIRVMIANFYGPDSEYGVSESIHESLRDLERHDTILWIIPYNGEITPQMGDEGARKIARDSGAAIIIWGWYRSTDEKVRFTVHYNVVRNPCCYRIAPDKVDVVEDALALENFSIQSDLSADVKSLASFTTGIVYYFRRDYRSALRAFGEALERGGGQYLAIDSASLDRIHHFRAFALWKTGEKRAALQRYTEVNLAQPNNWDAFLGKAILASELREFGIAGEALSAAEAAGGPPGPVFFARGLIQQRSGDTTGAIMSYGRAIEGEEPYGWALLNRGSLYLDRGAPESAIEDFTRAIDADSTTCVCAFINRAEAWIQLSRNHPERKKRYLSYAARDLSAVLRRIPRETGSRLRRAEVNQALGRSRRARDDLVQIIAQQPANGTARNDLAHLYLYQLSRPQDAIDQFEWLLANSDPNSQTYLHAARAYAWVGRVHEADAAYLHAIRLLPNGASRDSVLAERDRIRMTEQR